MNTALYPPVVEDYLPAFLESKDCEIRYKISDFASIEDINAVHLTIKGQNDNQNLLKENYETGMMEFQLEKKENSDYYFTVINSNDLKAGKFYLNRYYRVQLRFSSVYSNGQFNESFLNKNAANFSQWSSPILIRPIGEPIIQIEGFDITKDENIFNAIFNRIKGTIRFKDTNTELLHRYQISLIDLEDDTKIFESGDLFPKEGIGKIDCQIPLLFEDYKTYGLELHYYTNHGYEDFAKYYFSFVEPMLSPLSAKVIATPNRHRGSIGVMVSGDKISENIMIRRTSNKSSFKMWEDVHLFWILSDEEWKYYWEDFSVEPGVVYKYAVQVYDVYEGKELRGKINTTLNEIESISLFEDIFLFDGKRQLRVKFNPEINSLKYVVSESKTETLGSKYPFFLRGAETYYRTFPISGLITYKCDDYKDDFPLEYVEKEPNKIFKGFTFSEKDTPLFYDMRGNVYLESEDNFVAQGNEEIAWYKRMLKLDSNNYENDLDTYLEKMFREQVMDFLQDGNVKLFKSETEGNILVRLTDVSFSPEQQLGRKVYKFSATAVEIAEPTLDNYKKYGIINMNEFNNNLSKSRTFISQLKNCTDNNSNIINQIQNKARKETTQTITNFNKLHWIRICITSKPYPITQRMISNLKAKQQSVYNKNDLKSSFMGFLVRIESYYYKGFQKEPVQTVHVVKPHGVLELSENEISNLASISIFAPSYVNDNGEAVAYPLEYDVDFIVTLLTKENRARKVAEQSDIFGVGQLTGMFGVGPSYEIVETIFSKHSTEWNTKIDSQGTLEESDLTRHFRILEALNAIEIEASPGTVLKFKDTHDVLTENGSSYFRHIIGSSGYYHIYHPEGVVTSCYFGGVRLANAQYKDREIVNEMEFKPCFSKDEKTYNGLLIGKFKKNELDDEEVIHLLPKSQVFYKEVWRDISEIEYYQNSSKDNIVVKSFDAFIKDRDYLNTPVDDIIAITISCPVEATINYYYQIKEGTYQKNEQ